MPVNVIVKHGANGSKQVNPCTQRLCVGLKLMVQDSGARERMAEPYLEVGHMAYMSLKELVPCNPDVDIRVGVDANLLVHDGCKGRQCRIIKQTRSKNMDPRVRRTSQFRRFAGHRQRGAQCAAQM